MASLPSTHLIELAKILRRSMEVVSAPRPYRDYRACLTNLLDRLLKWSLGGLFEPDGRPIDLQPYREDLQCMEGGVVAIGYLGLGTKLHCTGIDLHRWLELNPQTAPSLGTSGPYGPVLDGN